MIRAEMVAVAEAPPSKRIAANLESTVRSAAGGAAGEAAAMESNPSSAADKGTRLPIRAE